jgi:hypothetical protein
MAAITNHREVAEAHLISAGRVRNADLQAAWGSTAAAHAVLALLDYIQQVNDDAVEDCEGIIDRQRREIEHLEEELRGTRDALRVRDLALTEELQERQRRDSAQAALVEWHDSGEAAPVVAKQGSDEVAPVAKQDGVYGGTKTEERTINERAQHSVGKGPV